MQHTKMIWQVFLTFSVVIIAIPLFILGGAYLSPMLPKFSSIIAQNHIFFTLFRWFLIGLFFFCWPYFIGKKAIFQKWSEEQKHYWLHKRFRVTCWLIIFELLICENLLMKCFIWLNH